MSESATATYEWNQLPWRKLEVAVFKLERRIYKASHAGDIRRVHRLQHLLLKSRAAQLLAVRRVTQDNQGKNTAGIDGIKALTPHQRSALAAHLGTLPTGRPTRRVWIPKPGKDDKRPLSIPTLHDRALQALVKLVLEPEWEARFEPNSYGFRPGRSVHDAIGAIFIAIEKQPKYALDADIAKCFDRIDQQALLRKLKTFPTLNRLVKAWLQAGVLDHGVFTETTTGTPQGGVASPRLANIALHGLESSSEAHYVCGLSEKAFASGFNAVRLNQRTCGGTEHLSEGLYHSGLTGDPLAVIRDLIEIDRLPSIAVAGYSLGGNLALKLAGDLGDDRPGELQAICAVSPTMARSKTSPCPTRRFAARRRRAKFFSGRSAATAPILGVRPPCAASARGRKRLRSRPLGTCRTAEAGNRQVSSAIFSRVREGRTTVPPRSSARRASTRRLICRRTSSGPKPSSICTSM